MPVPASVLELLQKTSSVTYSITTQHSTNEQLRAVPKMSNKCIVKALLLKDDKKQVAQVLVQEHAVIDLDAMFRSFDRKFEAVSASETWKLINSKDLQTVPAVPDWQSMTTYVDSSLSQNDVLLLDSGDGSNQIQVKAASFKEMTKHCRFGSFSTPATPAEEAQKDEQEILSSVERFTELRIRQRLDETIELPPLPETAQRIIKLRADPDADISDLTNIVEIDPSLAAQVVSWAASPYYSAPGKIKSVHDAIVRVLGFDMVLNLALGLALGKTLSMKALSKQDIQQYWQRSVYIAATVEGLVTSISREHRPGFGMAYLSGLLNNFGYLVMSEIFPPYFSTLSRARSANPHLAPALVERHTLGVSGDQIASWLLTNWSMPEEVVTALRQQNNLAYDGEHQAYAKLIYVAKQMLANRGFGDLLPAEIPDHVFASLHLDKEMAIATVENILDSGDDLNAIAEKMQG